MGYTYLLKTTPFSGAALNFTIVFLQLRCLKKIPLENGLRVKLLRPRFREQIKIILHLNPFLKEKF